MPNRQNTQNIVFINIKNTLNIVCFLSGGESEKIDLTVICLFNIISALFIVVFTVFYSFFAIYYFFVPNHVPNNSHKF